MKTQKAANGKSARPATREKKRVFSIFLDVETLKSVQHLAVDQERTMQALGAEAVEMLLDKYRRK